MATHNFCRQNPTKCFFASNRLDKLCISCQNKCSSFKALRRVPPSISDQLASELHHYTSGAFSGSWPCQAEVGFPSGRMTQQWITGTMSPSTAASVFATMTAIPWKRCYSSALPNPTRSTILAMHPMSGSMMSPWTTILSWRVSSTFANVPSGVSDLV